MQRRTKVVATLGPSTDDPKVMDDMIQAGVDVVRINFSHGSAEDHLNSIVLIAAIASGSKAKISCSSRVTPYDTYSSVLFTKRWFLKQVVRAFMWRADALTCVS